MRFCDNHVQKCTPYTFHENEVVIRQILEEGMDHAYGEFDVDDIFEWFMAGNAEVWLGLGPISGVTRPVYSVLVTRTKESVLNVLFWSGKAWEWDAVHYCINEIAKMEGCQDITFRGRRGFLRCFKEYGAKEKYTILTMGVV
jgi:hypothetical protein